MAELYSESQLLGKVVILKSGKRNRSTGQEDFWVLEIPAATKVPKGRGKLELDIDGYKFRVAVSQATKSEITVVAKP